MPGWFGRPRQTVVKRIACPVARVFNRGWRTSRFAFQTTVEPFSIVMSARPLPAGRPASVAPLASIWNVMWTFPPIGYAVLGVETDATSSGVDGPWVDEPGPVVVPPPGD